MVGETKQINKIIIEAGGDEYVFEGGGGGQPGPDTVGTEQIIDDSVELKDLNTEVKDKMTNHYDAQGEGIVLGGLVANNSQDVGQGGSEDSDDDETGFENNADNGSDDI